MALFRTNFLPYSETFILDQIRFHRRYAVRVFSRRRLPSAPPGLEVTALRSPEQERRLTTLWFNFTGRSPLLERALRESGARLVHAHFGHNATDVLGLVERTGLPLVVSLHGRDVSVLAGSDRRRFEYWHYTWRSQRLLRRAALFLAASSDLAELWARIGCPREKIVVHRLGIDLEGFRQAADGEREAPPLVLMIGRFVEKKGGRYALEAAAHAQRAGCEFRFVLVGDGPLRAEYERLVDELGLRSVVEFAGVQPHHEVQRWVRRAAVLLAPSVVAQNLDRDSGLLVAKEAAASAVPVIGTWHGGIPDIVEDGVTGFLVPERDGEALGARLVELLRDDELRRRFGAAARAKMEREYDIRARMQELEALYDRVLAEAPRAAL